MASPTNFPYGPGMPQDNITALPAGQAKVLGSIGTANLPIFDINFAPMSFTTTTGASGTIEIYAACSENGGAAGNWTDGINPTSAGDQSAQISQARLCQSINVIGAGTYRLDEWWLYSALGGTPMFVCLIVFNKTGQPLGGTSGGFYLQYSLLNYASPNPVVFA